MSIDHHLATYGSLAPGRSNHHHLAGLAGQWIAGTVRGHLFDRGWAAGLGYPALVPDAGGDEIAVQCFMSPDLPRHWSYLDEFEGSDYRRARITVETAEGPLDAWIYIDAGSPD